MGGEGSFVEPKLALFIRTRPDRVTPKLKVLLAYQLSLEPPPPPPGLDPVAVSRGEELFMQPPPEGAGCAGCHVPPTFTDAPKLWPTESIPTDPAYAERDEAVALERDGWRTTPLRGLAALEGAFFHDGSAATLEEVVDVYDVAFGLGLTPQEKQDLVEFLKTL